MAFLSIGVGDWQWMFDYVCGLAARNRGYGRGECPTYPTVEVVSGLGEHEGFSRKGEPT